MNEKQYRKRLQTKVATARAQHDEAIVNEISNRSGKKASPISSAADRLAAQKQVHKLREADVFDTKQPSAKRIEALHKLVSVMAENQELTKRVIRLFGDKDDAVGVRMAALQVLKVVAFSSRTTDKWMPTYLNQCRRVAKENVPELSAAAFRSLAQKKDGWALKQMEDGLRDPKKAVLSPLEAIQNLSYDDHGGHFDLLRTIAGRHRSDRVREEAIRGLAQDPSSKDLLVSLIHAPKETPRIKKAALLSLRQVDGEAYKQEASRILSSADEHEDVQASVITALRVDSGSAGEAIDQSIGNLAKNANSEMVRSVANQYLKD